MFASGSQDQTMFGQEPTPDLRWILASQPLAALIESLDGTTKPPPHPTAILSEIVRRPTFVEVFGRYSSTP